MPTLASGSTYYLYARVHDSAGNVQTSFPNYKIVTFDSYVNPPSVEAAVRLPAWLPADASATRPTRTR